jgi:hypothetical protein
MSSKLSPETAILLFDSFLLISEKLHKEKCRNIIVSVIKIYKYIFEGDML